MKYYFAFNENSDGKAFFGDVWGLLISKNTLNQDDGNGNWEVKTYYTVDDNNAFPMALYRSDRCLKGYSFSADGGTAYRKLENAVIAQYERSAVAHNFDNPMKLYAVWGECPANASVTTVALEGTANGKYSFERKFNLGLNAATNVNDSTDARVYESENSSFKILAANDDVSFTNISFNVTAAGVLLDTEAKFAYKGVTTAWMPTLRYGEIMMTVS